MNWPDLKNNFYYSLLFAILGALTYWLGKGVFVLAGLSWLGFLLWLIGVSYLSFRLLFIFLKNHWSAYFLSPLLVFFLLGFVFNAFNSLWLFNYFSITLSLLLVFILLLFFVWWLDEEKFEPIIVSAKIKLPTSRVWFPWMIIFLLGVFAWLGSLTGVRVNNPWWFLSPVYLLACLSLFAYNLYLIFDKKYSAKALLILIALLSFLVHGYLSVSLVGFDGDRFRHLGSEYRLLNHIAEVNPEIRSAYWERQVPIGPFAVPKPLVNLAQFSYSFQWTLVAFLADLLVINALYVDLYLGWLIWSFFVPLLFYAGGRLIFRESKILPLFLAQGSLVPYLLIYNGGQTLPVAFGAIFFLLFSVLCLAVLDQPAKKKILFLLMLAGLAFFSYTLSFIAVAVAWLLLALKSKNIASKKIWLVISVISILLVLIEGLSTYSWLIVPSLEKIYRQFFGLNIIFFASDYFYRYSFPWLSGFWKIATLAGYAWFIFLLSRCWATYKNNRQFIFIIGLTAMFLLSFLLGITFLDGVLATIKRLNVFLALLLVWLSGYIFYYFQDNCRRYKKLLIFILTLFFGLAFVSGPFTIFASSVDDVLMGKYLSEQIGRDWKNHCVLADIFVLLPVETYTDREIAGGNFPLAFNHSQSELNSLLDRIKKDVSGDLLDEIFATTKIEKCFIVLDSSVDSEIVAKLTGLVGNYQFINNKHLWLIAKFTPLNNH